MHTTNDDADLIAVALGEADDALRRTIDERARADGELRRRLRAYVEIVGASRESSDSRAPIGVLRRLTAAQRARTSGRKRLWSTLTTRVMPAAAAALAVAIALGSGVSVLGDALEPHPIGSTGTAPSDALLVATRGAVEARALVVPLQPREWASATVVAWDSLTMRPSSGDTGAADSL